MKTKAAMNILFDCGATNLRLAATADKKTFQKIVTLKTPKKLDRVVELIARTAGQLAGGQKIESLTGGITGFLDNSRGQKTAALLKKKIDALITVENDAALVGLGEARFGAGRGFSVVVYFTVSTGVGGARIVDQRIDRSVWSFEPGHQIISLGRRKKSLEDLVSGKAVSQKFGQDPRTILEPEVWRRLAETLAVGLYNSILHWSPEAVVLGGPMITGQPAIPIKLVKKHLKKLLKIFPKAPSVKKARLGNYGGLYGALALINRRQNSR